MQPVIVGGRYQVGIGAGATLSECGTYRYDLWRCWADQGTLGVFCMVNPSTADAEADDPTIRRVTGFAKSFGWRGFVVVNAFALRATDPRKLKKHLAPTGPENDATILGWAAVARPFVVAWGQHGELYGRDRKVYDLLVGAGVQPWCLGVTTKGNPRHPLYLPKDVQLIPWRMP